MGTAPLISIVIGVTAGALAAVRPYSPFDYAASLLAMLGVSVPKLLSGAALYLCVLHRAAVAANVRHVHTRR